MNKKANLMYAMSMLYGTLGASDYNVNDEKYIIESRKTFSKNKNYKTTKFKDKRKTRKGRKSR